MKKFFFALIIFWSGTIICSVNPDNQFVLITSLYNEKKTERIAEYITCFERNMKHPLIKKIHVLFDVTDNDENNVLWHYLQNNGAEISTISGRPSFAACFDLANKHYPHQKIMVSNADIYFNETLNILEQYDLHMKFFALTRWNVKVDGSLEIFKQYDSKGTFEKNWSERSQDVWIFTTPINVPNSHDILVGTWFCDGRIVFRALEAKLQVKNPCLTIQCCHLHLSNVRNYPITANKGYKTAAAPWCILD